jgi:predicted methyltransferase
MIKRPKKSAARKLMQDSQDKHFRERVRTRVCEILCGAPTITFEHILKRSFNCDPAFLLDVLRELKDDDFIYSTEDGDSPVRYSLKERNHYLRTKTTTFRRSATNPCLGISSNSPQTEYFRELLQNMLDSFPEEAPIYSQWWFSESIYEHLIRLIMRLSKPRESLAFLGSSTLGALLSHFSNNPVNIFDVDSVLLERISHCCSESTQTINYDVSNEPDSSFKEKFQLVFVDPPWSSSALRVFLLRSSTFVSIGGNLAISFPQILTRPSVELERQELLNLAQNLGLSLKLVLQGFTEYSVPAFERNAYEHCGIQLQEPWRRGELFIFTKTHDRSIDIMPLIEKTPEWSQYKHGKCRLFLKRDGLFEDGLPSVQPIPGLEDLMYKSVSTRMASWKSASLVSTRNHIAHAYGRRQLSELLEGTFSQAHDKHRNHAAFAAMIPMEIKETVFSMLNINTA